MAKMKIEIALESKAIEQFIKDFRVNNGVVKKLEENDEKVEEMVMQYLHKGGLSAEEVTFMDCYLVKVMSATYCEAYNNCMNVTDDEDGV